jgi:hypothetical protein
MARGTHMAQDLSFARIYSETDRKGRPRMFIIAFASRRRGPSSPAERISISLSNRGMNACMRGNRHCQTYFYRGNETVVFYV